MTKQVDDICYKKTFIKEVVARIDFAAPSAQLAGAILPETFQKAIKSRYKIYEPNKGQNQTFEIKESGVSAITEEFHQWTFHGENRDKTITINPSLVLVSLKSYRTYDDFIVDFIEPLKKLVQSDTQLAIRRTGLRFVNIFEGLTTSLGKLSNYFHPMVSSPFKKMVDAGNCSRSVAITDYLYDDYKMRIQSGIFNPDYPAKIKKNDFVLDFDCWMDTPHSMMDVAANIDQLHSAIQGKFEDCITPALRELMSE